VVDFSSVSARGDRGDDTDPRATGRSASRFGASGGVDDPRLDLPQAQGRYAPEWPV